MSRQGWMGTGAAGVVLALAVAIAVVSMISRSDATPIGGPTHMITVTSAAAIGTAPDEAVVDFTVRSEGADAPSALAASAKATNPVIAALKAAGLVQRDIATQELNVGRTTLDRGTPQERTVWTATQRVEAKIHDLTAVGTVIKAGVDAGATSVNGLRFQVSDESAARETALAAAVQGARAKATAMAKAAGVGVTGVIQMKENSSNYHPYYAQRSSFEAFAGDLAAAPAIIPPHTIKTSVSVTVVWSLG
jgi:uncharacterized protein